MLHRPRLPQFGTQMWTQARFIVDFIQFLKPAHVPLKGMARGQRSTVTLLHSPPRAVLTFRLFSAAAMACFDGPAGCQNRQAQKSNPRGVSESALGMKRPQRGGSLGPPWGITRRSEGPAGAR